MTKRQLLAGATAMVFLTFAGAAYAADEPSSSDEIVVHARDKAKLLETGPSDTVFGLDKPLIETARSATFVSDTTMERYGIKTIDDLKSLSPGSYTASFYGVPGALNIRGTLAENYFRGFKRIENRGTYSTPIGDAAQIEIVRGPPTPIYGAGKVGGLLNFIPKSARTDTGYLTEPEGQITAQLGTYHEGQLTGQYSVPFKAGIFDGGLHIYGEYEAGSRYYRGISPEKRLVEASGDFDMGNGWSTAFGGMIFDSSGNVQTPGWNRLTQDLVDHQTYITGRDTSVSDLNGDGRLEPLEERPGGTYPYNVYTYAFYGSSDAFHTLDTGVGTTKLSPRSVYISNRDFSNTRTNTYYADLKKDFGGGQTLKLQLFYDDLDNSRFVSYGYPASFQSDVWEGRLTYNFAYDAGPMTSKSFVGVSYRDFNGRRRESYNTGLIALDRRDISYGATPTDIIDDPYSTESVVGMGWDIDNNSKYTNGGIFATTDIFLWKNLNVTLGGRYDNYDVESHDTGQYSFETSAIQKDSKGKGTYSASVSYQTPWGIMPYYTYAKASSLEVSQAGDIAPSLIQTHGWLSDSDLNEAGLKFQFLHGTLVGSLAAYRQNRSQLISPLGGATTTQGTQGKGLELEVRWLATEHFSFVLTANNQSTRVKDRPGFSYLPAFAFGVPGVGAYGGTYVTFDLGGLFPSLANGYKYTLIPDTVASLYGTYTSSPHEWGQVGATLGVTYVDKTAGFIPGAVVLPSYETANMSAFYTFGRYTVTANMDNVFNKLYFTPLGDSYSNMAVLPGRGRESRITLKATF